LKTLALYSPEYFEANQTLQTIDDEAFKGCSKFVGVSEEVGLVIPYSVQNYGAGVFEGCTSLNKVTFNESAQQHLTQIAERMFKGCVSLAFI
ncbi:hypothetical protein ELD19_29835, partial [Klebsiella pneumoniae]|nr:hypothetical protein [Klebsiella pneumoniae]